MKVIIPVAGAGAKLRPHTYTQPKPLIPLAGKTILSFILDQFIDAGQQDFIFIIGYLGEKIRDYVHEKYPGINATFLVQNERQGTGHAVYLAKDHVALNEEMLIIYGDTICDFNLPEVLQSEHSLIGVKKVDDPRDFGVAEINADGFVKHVIEKPKIPKSNLALVGIYKIKESSKMFEIIEEQFHQDHTQEEYHFTNVLDAMVKSGLKIGTFQVNNWFDCGKKESLLETNAILLNKVEYASEEIPFFDNTIVIHPVSIAEGCVIENSIIGPNVTIGEKAVIRSSMVRDSIIGSYSVIEKVVLHSSLIGSDAYICGASQSLNIGDNTEIDLSK
ncbi:MAG: NTP transferase domain-containing protein [Chitinophagaceae bacterium]|nr:NTP transferase domain-containing protein [Chitinophagaceae bacterium]